MRQIVEPLGFGIVEAETAAKVWTVEITTISKSRLVDWNMPEMNGLEFVQAIRARQR
ncbi:MAG: hypothetical protein U0992_07725 [Planctomycetaceae bacterium]